jgi:hypothetical protein
VRAQQPNVYCASKSSCVTSTCAWLNITYLRCQPHPPILFAAGKAKSSPAVSSVSFENSGSASRMKLLG